MTTKGCDFKHLTSFNIAVQPFNNSVCIPINKSDFMYLMTSQNNKLPTNRAGNKN